jgi:hypothetical protein
VGAENLRDQAIFVNHASGAIAPLDPELIEIRDAVGQWAERCCLLQGAVAAAIACLPLIAVACDVAGRT